MYGQRDASTRWYNTLKQCLIDEEGMVPSENNPCLFVNAKTNLKFVVHVDDGLLRGPKKESERFWAAIKKRFGVKLVEHVSDTNGVVYCGIRINT